MTTPVRELILLRHAHAEPAATGQADFDRPLSPHGLAEAEAAGRWLLEHRLVPDRVLCSPARRSRETLEAVLGSTGYVEQRLEPRIYEATSGTLADLLDSHREVERLLLVGHNPGLERLAALMHSGQSGDYRGMPTASVVVLALPQEAAIEPGIARLTAFWWP
ncbi:histidine phosphatase family protein [Xanthomonas sp. AmX2]|uniref:SixA phosphatase family protein n=1 Tax=Xanthomonas sp. TaxID=29446 RepID=UPI0019801E34|nr:histidine phosphatase family protein [Xanthomonas sp.]MBN6150674.1 histidine phosphatase family protein [Xanthomonas sp.]